MKRCVLFTEFTPSTVSIFAAEFGDKTFFINCILAMTNNMFHPISLSTLDTFYCLQ